MLNSIGIPLKNRNKNKTITHIPIVFFFLFTKNAFDEMQHPFLKSLGKKSININSDFSIVLETEIIGFRSKNSIKITMILIIIVPITTNNI